MGKIEIRTLLAIGWSIVATVYIFGVTFGYVPTENVRFADTVIGFMMGTIVSAIIQYFFGSSKGSSDKNDMIKNKE